MKMIENKTFDMERALYGSQGVTVKNCAFDGPADGESALTGRMKKVFIVLVILLFLFSFAACGNDTDEAKIPAPHTEGETEAQAVEQPEVKEESDMLNSEAADTIRLFIGEEELPVKWENNESVDALRELVGGQPLSIQMSMYGGFEQVGALGTDLPRNDVQTTTSAGDIVLYSGNQIVMFYGSNSWAYTRLGKVTDMSADEMTELLGNGDVVITLSE